VLLKVALSPIGIVVLVRAGAVWSGVGTLAVALEVLVRAGAVWSGVGTLAVALEVLSQHSSFE